MCRNETIQEWLVIVNPNAGIRRGIKDWYLISSLLEKYGFDFLPMFTERPRHAIEITKKHVEEGFNKIIVVGGDGTMNEVINGIFQQTRFHTTQVIIGMITIGTGNDWGRMFNIPRDYEQAVKTIKNCKVFIQDAGVVKYSHEEGTENRYFINIAGLGFDAVVTRKSNKLKEKGKGGQFLYFANIFSCLLRYKHVNAVINIDGKDYENKIFSMNVGIGKYNGGGMIQLPKAIANDGLFDLTVIKKLSKPDVILSLKRLYNGTISEHPKVETYTGKSIKIDSDTKIHLETDGESLGHTPLEFEIIPQSLKVISGYQLV